MPGREWCDFDIVGMEGIPEEFQATTKGPSFLPNEKEVLQACLMRKQQALQILNSFLLQGTIKSFADHENGNGIHHCPFDLALDLLTTFHVIGEVIQHEVEIS